MKQKIYILLLLSCSSLFAQEKNQQYWNISNRESIIWDLTEENKLPHSDNIEMAGEKVASIIYYTIDKNKNLILSRDIIYPQLRTFNKSNEPEWKKHRAYFRHTFGSETEPNLFLGEKQLIPGKIDSVEIGGKLIFHHAPVQGIQISRTLLPSMKERLFVEKWELKNTTQAEQRLKIGNTEYYSVHEGYKGKYTLHAYSDAKPEVTLLPGKSYSFAMYFSAGINYEPVSGFDFKKTAEQRDSFLHIMQENLVLQTENEILNTLFYFSKIRAAENIFASKLGLIHSPGGGNYYVGVWANDQVEYSGPFFPFLGYKKANVAAFNAYKVFLDNIPENFKPISSSFEIEGELPCCGKDRGDAAMIAYGTSKFALLLGDEEKAKVLWPLITWSLEYCKRNLNDQGVVMSTTDEMEGRISTGDANLATSSLYYGGLKFASYLAAELGYADEAKTYTKQKKALAKAIENYFGFTLEGLDTYRYFDGNTHLRHWICLPLVMGIEQRKDATTKALLEKLWTENGVLVELNPDSNQPDIFWDRGTLYALRGTFKAGAVNESYEKLVAFSQKRLLGEHVPYVIEAYPENNMRHLSAESALYCRIFIEGLLGFEQTGFNSFTFTPQLPENLNHFKLSEIHMDNEIFSIELTKAGDKIHVKISSQNASLVDKTLPAGQQISVSF